AIESRLRDRMFTIENSAPRAGNPAGGVNSRHSSLPITARLTGKVMIQGPLNTSDGPTVDCCFSQLYTIAWVERLATILNTHPNTLCPDELDRKYEWQIPRGRSVPRRRYPRRSCCRELGQKRWFMSIRQRSSHLVASWQAARPRRPSNQV